MAYDNLSGEATCPICGGTVEIVEQMHFAKGGPRRWFHVGDPVVISEWFVRDCMPAGPRPPSDVVRLCEHTVWHCGERLWLVVEVAAGCLASLELVRPSVAVVDGLDLIERNMRATIWTERHPFIVSAV